MQVAVIVPGFNEEPVIRDTIEALYRAGKKPEDIYVVDDASKDKTPEIARQMGVHTLALTTNVGKSEALNSAIAHFNLCDKYEYVAFLDADTRVGQDYFKVLEDAIAHDPDVSLFVGQVKSARGGYISASRVYEYQISHDLFKAGQSLWGLIFVAPGCTSVYKTDVLRDLRYGGDTLAEDMDLTIQVQRMKARKMLAYARWLCKRKVSRLLRMPPNEEEDALYQQVKGKIVYLPKAVVYTQDPATLRDYLKQVRRWYRGGWQVLKKHRIMWPFKLRWQLLDIFLAYIMSESLVINRITWGLIAIIFGGVEALLILMGAELGMMWVLALYASVKNKRADVFYKFPLYVWLVYVNQVLYLYSFAEIFIFRKGIFGWNKVGRYVPT